MNLEKELMDYRNENQIEPKEDKIQETILKSKACFFQVQQETDLPYHEFLWEQLKVMKKRWWIYQSILLLALWEILVYVKDIRYIQKSMGIMATLFVIVIIPEFWRNRSFGCMEIEGTSYYSLRQIYAARMLLFGVIDVFLLTLFSGTISVYMEYKLTELLVQFLFPMSVTACICFGILCSKRTYSEGVAMILCMLWSFVWLFISLNKKIYEALTLPIWLCLFGISMFYLLYAAFRVLNRCDNYWEVSWDGIETR